MALLMIDADLFKQFNDSHGHQAGDQMLIGIAVCIADSVHRAGDCAARFGGEEFAVLLPGLSAQDALSVAESIRSKVERWSLDQTGVTISVGVASLVPAPSVHWSELVEAADKALYVAKESGRNVCVIAASHEPLPMVA
jgi:diguanylate cyclase (GGDEF)-like protein